MKKLLLALALTTTAAARAGAELVYLKDGNVVAGTIIGVTADALEIQLSGGKTTIRKDAIERIDYAQAGAPPPERARRPATLSRGERLLLAGLGGGFPLKAQGFSRDAKADLAGMIEYVLQTNDYLGIGLSFDAPGFAANYPSDDLFTRKSEVTAAGLEIVARVVAMPKSRLSPVLDFGAGLDSYSQIIETTSKATGQFTETHDTVSGLAVVAGAGVQYLYKQRGVLQLEARWHYLQANVHKFGVDGAQAASLIASVGCRF